MDVYGREYCFIEWQDLLEWELELLREIPGGEWVVFTLTSKMSPVGGLMELGETVSLFKPGDSTTKMTDYVVREISINKAIKAAKVGYATLVKKGIVIEEKEEKKD